MGDHNFIQKDGTLIPVSKMSIEDIKNCLEEGIVIHNTDGQMPLPESVMERLRIELLIRELNL